MNISEFAAEAGVSKSAVSRYFNQGYLSEEKRQKIEAAIQRTGYAPSVAARNVKTRVTKLVGVILPKLSSESCSRVTEGISQVLSEEGYELLLVNTSNREQKEVEYLDLFRHNRVDGVIFLASVFTKQHRSVLHKMRIPVIIVGQEYPGFNCVCHDDFGASYALTKLMLEKGGEQPGYIGVLLQDQAAGQARYNGFRKAVLEKQDVIRKEFTAIADFTIDSGYAQAAKILSQKRRPDCLFCATDNIAAGAIQYCIEHQIRVPEDLMIAAVGDSQIAKVTAVPITSAHLHYKTAGIEAAQMLLSAIRRQDAIPKILQLSYEIVERTSTER